MIECSIVSVVLGAFTPGIPLAKLLSHKRQKIAAEGDGVVVMYNYREGKKTAIPEEIRKRILAIEKMG